MIESKSSVSTKAREKLTGASSNCKNKEDKSIAMKEFARSLNVQVSEETNTYSVVEVPFNATFVFR
jgi:hypothetical protein